MNIEEHLHCLFASSTSTAFTAFIASNAIQDMIIRGIISIIVGVTTWLITQTLSYLIKKYRK